MMCSFSSILIVHNPVAGDSNISKKILLETLDKKADTIKYVSVKDKEWKESLEENSFDAIFLAGGDGTVHKLLNALIEKNLTNPIVVLIPTGTANNIHRTLQGELKSGNKILPSSTCFYAGFIKENNHICYESIGFGIFPLLLNLMKKKNLDAHSKEIKLKKIYQHLIESVQDFNGVEIAIEVNGEVLNDNFLLVEFSNLVSIGPNLEIAPKASPYSGLFYLVLIPQSKKEAFLTYLQSTQRNYKNNQSSSSLLDFTTFIKAKKVKFIGEASNYHRDDTLYENDGILSVNVNPTEIVVIPFSGNLIT